MAGTIRRRLLLHVAVRVAAATVLLGAAFGVQLRTPGEFGVNPFFMLIALVYAVSLGFIASLRFVDRFPWLIDVHFAIDAVLVSAGVALTGGIYSLFTMLYVLPIVAASTLQYRRGALQVATLSCLLYTGVVLMQYLQVAGLLEPPFGIGFAGPLPDRGAAQFTIGLSVFGLFGAALLSGSLAERLRRADVRLEQASEEIADLQFFNQYVIDNLVSGLATADVQNRVLTFNRSALQITGLTLPAVLGKPATKVLQLPDDFAGTLDRALERARSRRVDLQYRRADGTTITLGVAVTRLPLPNGGLGYLYTFQDVTEMKRLEREAQLQKRLAAIGEMAAGIAHEIRNPLASMSGSMQILRQELRLTRDQAELMDIVLRESERLNDTIRSFLAYARPQRTHIERLDLRRLVQDTATLLRNSAELGDQHTIEVYLAAHEVAVDGDENQIKQIVWNLATNGLRAMPRGGRLTLATGHDPRQPGAGVLTVSDEGVGISAEEVEKIFQPFRAAFGKGTGLGLAIVHRIASDYNAEIDVRSQPGRGTTFRVTFPPAVEPRASKAS